MVRKAITTKEEWLVSILARAERRGDCLVWTGGLSPSGYGWVCRPEGLRHLIAKPIWRVHRAAHYLRHGDIVGHVLHHCDNRPCIEDAHLFEGTPADNTADMIAKGRKKNAYSTTKLSWEAADFIRSHYTNGRTPYGTAVKLARMFGVSLCCISDIGHGRTWVREE